MKLLLLTARSALVLMVVLSCASCGRKPNGLFPVTGKVLFQGEPATGATVFLHRQGTDSLRGLKENVTMGVVQNDGTFEVVCGSLGKGGFPGDYDVTIEWRQVVDQKKGAPRRGPDKLKGRFSDPKNTRYHISIKTQPNQVPAFELSD